MHAISNFQILYDQESEFCITKTYRIVHESFLCLSKKIKFIYPSFSIGTTLLSALLKYVDSCAFMKVVIKHTLPE